MIEIIPAIMPRRFHDIEDDVSKVVRHVENVQIDIMDGKFVESRSWPYFSNDEYFDKLLNEDVGLPHWEDINYEIDLMVEHPETVIDEWIIAGASRLIVHIESTTHMRAIIEDINKRFGFREKGIVRDIELGIALSTDTPIHTITEYLEDVDFVQFMGINKIGFQGEAFDERVIDKIREFHNAHPEVIISVDGGVTLENAPLLVEAGVKRLVSGSAIFKGGIVHETIEQFKNI